MPRSGHHRLLAGFTHVLIGCAAVLRPGGHIVITVRPWREHAELIDLPSQIMACGRAAGLVPVERCVALLARVADTDLVVAESTSPDHLAHAYFLRHYAFTRGKMERAFVSLDAAGCSVVVH